MILYTDSVIQLRYSPATDVMTVSLQVVRAYEAAEIKSAFQAVLANIREYHVTRLLLALTHNTLDLTETEYRQNITTLTAGLAHTSIRRIARVGSPDPTREDKIMRIYESVKTALALQVDVKSFPDQPGALEWLTSSNL